MGLDNNANHSGAGGDTVIYNADGSLREYRDDEWTGEIDRPTLSAQLAYNGANGSIGNFNASLAEDLSSTTSRTARAPGPACPIASAACGRSEGGHNYELGWRLRVRARRRAG